MYLVRTNISHYIFKYVFNPFMYGIYGFFVFFITDILLKLFIIILDSDEIFSIYEQDIVLGLLGFFAFFLVKFVKNLNEQRRLN